MSTETKPAKTKFVPKKYQVKCSNSHCQDFGFLITSDSLVCKRCTQPMDKILETTIDESVSIPSAIEKALSQQVISQHIPTPTVPVTIEKEEKEIEINIENFDIEKTISEVVKSFIHGKEEYIRFEMAKLVAVAVKKIKPVVVKIAEREEIKIEGTVHERFIDVLFFAQHERQSFIAGPAGSGKTTLAAQVATAMGLSFAHISCSSGMSEAHLLGRMLFDGTYVTSDLVESYEKGGVFLFDEIDAADSNTLLVINSALANGVISVPNRKGNTHAKRHKDFICICAGNTWGDGSFEYQGRNNLDAAFLDRFSLSKVEVDYDIHLEKKLCTDSELYSKLSQVRTNVKKNKLRRIVSTRAFISAQRQLNAGKTQLQILDTFFTGWSHEERAKSNA